MHNDHLVLENVHIGHLKARARPAPIVRNVGLSVGAGETVGLVGQSGSGKTMIAHAILGMLPDPLRVLSGRICFDGTELTGIAPSAIRRLRGGKIGMIFQDPQSSLNPIRPIGAPLIETLMRHGGFGRKEARNKAIAALGDVGIMSPETRMRSYPHEFSGGQLQRIMIALAISNDPELIIADEPTTALDATVQVRILTLLKALSTRRSLLLITHDLGVAGSICDRLVILKEGSVVETGRADDVLSAPQTDYARELVAAVPRFGPGPAGRGRNQEPESTRQVDEILSVKGLSVSVRTPMGRRNLVQDISLQVKPGDIVALVGESGSGKSTIAKAIVGLGGDISGEISVGGEKFRELTPTAFRKIRQSIQLVFQNSFASLDPRWPIERILSEPLLAKGGVARAERRRIVQEALAQFDVPLDAAARVPPELSGGQRQRISLSRALVAKPALLLADEPLSAVDVVTKRRLMSHLLAQRARGLSILIIAHELPMVYQLADYVYVLRGGRVMEHGPTTSVLGTCAHPYTAVLMASTYVCGVDFDRSIYLQGERDLELQFAREGCPYRHQCPIAQPLCAEKDPPLRDVGGDQMAACHFPGELKPPAALFAAPANEAHMKL